MSHNAGMFKLTFLGTSSGVPTRYRNVTSLALQTTHNHDWWMIDCGEATQHRLQRVPLSVHDLVGICITHVHGDHSYGLPGLLASASMTGRKKPLLLIAPAAIKAWIDATLLHTELFLTYPLIHIDVDSTPIVYQEAGLAISRHALSHRAPSGGYRFAWETRTWKLDKAALLAAGVPPGPAWGVLQAGQDALRDDGTVLSAAAFRQVETQRATVVIGGDNDTPSLLMDACKDAQLLVLEATYTEAMLQKIGPGPTHSSVQRGAQFAQCAQLPNVILTHFSARYHNSAGMAELEAEARLHYSGQLFLAHDFDSYELDAAGVLLKVAAKSRDSRD